MHLKKYWLISLVFLVFLIIVLGSDTTAFCETSLSGCTGPLVDPVRNPDGNGNPPLLGAQPPGYSARIEDPSSGTIYFGGSMVHYEIYNEGRFLRFWTEGDHPVVDKVVVKGGPNANSYDYSNDPVSSDCNLCSPEHPKEGSIPAISYFDIYVTIPQTGSLRVEKQFVFNEVTGYSFDVSNISIRLEGPSYPEGKTFFMDISEQGEGSLEFRDLLPGDYSVSEEYAGEEWESTVTGNSKVISSQTATVEIINTFRTGSLVINKEFVFDSDTDVTQIDDIAVRLKGPSFSEEGEVFVIDISESGNGSRAWYGLIPGKYEVKEEQSGKEWIADIPNNGEVEVIAEQTAFVDITNTHILYGGIDVKKVVIGEESGDDTIFHFTLTGGDLEDPIAFDLKNGEEWNNRELTAGSYTITETLDPNTGYRLAGYTVNEGILQKTDSVTVVVAGGEVVKITAENQVVAGQVTVYKNPEDTETISLLDELPVFDFELFRYDQSRKEYLLQETFQVAYGGSRTISGLLYGEYLVREKDDPEDGWIICSNNDQEFSVDDGALDTSLVFCNEPVETSLTVYKEAGNGETDDEIFGFELWRFDYTQGTDGDYILFRSFNIALGGSYMLENIPFGDYKIVELQDEEDGWLPCPDSEIEKYLTINSDVLHREIYFCNFKVSGTVTIHKSCDGYADDSAMFEVRRMLNEEDFEVFMTAEVPFNSSLKIGDIPAGIYIIHEIQDPEDGWVLSSANDLEVIISEKDHIQGSTDKSVYFVNEKIEAILTISKKVQNRPNDMTRFAVNISGPAEYEGPSMIWVHQGQDGTAVLSGLPLGTYVITEAPVSGYSPAGAASVTITLNEQNTSESIEFINIPDPVIKYATITIIKDVTGEESDITEFEMVINDTIKIKVKEGGPVSLTLPLGSYRVAETPMEGYETISISPGAFTLDTEGQQLTIHAVNRKTIPEKEGSLTIEKRIDDDVPDGTYFTIFIEGPQGYKNEVYVSADKPIVLSGLKLGTYILTEEEKEGYIILSEKNISVSLTVQAPDANVEFINGLDLLDIIDDEIPGTDPILPATGGIPPSISLIFGCIIIISGLALLFIQSRRSQKHREI